MSLRNQCIVIVLCYLLAYIFIRWFLWGVKEYPINKSARKKRKEGQTFKEWFLYSRYREEIPKPLLFLYFTIVIVHPLVLIACIIINIISSFNEIGYFLPKFIAFFDFTWVIVIDVLFWQAKPGYKYERWINKKRGKKSD